MQYSYNFFSFFFFHGNPVVPVPFIHGTIPSSLVLNASFIICLTSICTWVYFWVLFYSSDLFVYFSSKATNYRCFIMYFSMLGPPSLFFFSNFLIIILFGIARNIYITYIWETLAVLLCEILPLRIMVCLCVQLLFYVLSVKLCSFPQTSVLPYLFNLFLSNL